MKKSVLTFSIFFAAAMMLLGAAFFAFRAFSPAAVSFEAGDYDGYYYNELSEVEKQAYTAVEKEISSFPEAIPIPSLSEKELSNVLSALLYDNPEIFYLDTCKTVTRNGFCSFVPEYNYTKEEYSAMSNKLESKINQIIRSAPLSSEYDTELYIHDYIVNSCEYLHTSGPEERTVIGSLINSKANCSGYAKAVKILLNRLNIKCILVVGRADNFVDEPQNHMWNIVRIGGKYYHLDATWDDPTGAADNDGSRRVFFNMSDSMIKRTHSEINVKIKCPEDDKYFYRVSERYFTDYTDSVRLKMAHALAVAADAGERSVDFVFASKGAYEKAKKDLITSERIYRIPELANVEAKRKLVTDRVSYSTDDELFILVLVIQYD